MNFLLGLFAVAFALIGAIVIVLIHLTREKFRNLDGEIHVVRSASYKNIKLLSDAYNRHDPVLRALVEKTNAEYEMLMRREDESNAA